MGNRKDIGKLFNEQFKDFEQAPSADLWDTIASELDQKSDRKIAPFWFYFGGVLIVGMLTGILYWAPWDTLTSPKTNDQPIVNTTQAPIPDAATTISSSSPIENTTTNRTTNTEQTVNTSSNNISSKTTSDQNITENTTVQTDTNNTSLTTNTAGVSTPPQNTNSNNTQIVSTDKNTSRTNNATSNQTGRYTTAQNDEKTTSIIEVLRTMKSVSQETREKKELEAKTAYQAKIKEELALAIAAQKEDNKIANQKWLDSIQAIEKAEKIKKAALATTNEEEKPINKKVPKLPKTEEEREKDRKESVNYKFAVSPYTSILSYGSLTKGSSIDNRLVDNPRDAIGTIGYGIRADYRLSERSSIRFGIGIAPLQYRTDDFQVLITNNNVNIFQLSGIDPQNLGQTGGIEPSPEALAFFNSNNVVSIEQNISYVEVPIDYQYRFLNKRVSMSFNSGLSLFVLTNNRVFATANSGESIFIGRETSLKDLSLALNLGLGTQYNFSKNWRFDVEPAFKYQLNPYTENIGNFKPYYFGLQFGISYKF